MDLLAERRLRRISPLEQDACEEYHHWSKTRAKSITIGATTSRVVLKKPGIIPIEPLPPIPENEEFAEASDASMKRVFQQSTASDTDITTSMHPNINQRCVTNPEMTAASRCTLPLPPLVQCNICGGENDKNDVHAQMKEVPAWDNSQPQPGWKTESKREWWCRQCL